MGIEETYADDFKVIDGYEEIVFTSVDSLSPSVTANFTCPFTTSEDLTTSEVSDSEGFYQMGDKRFLIGRKLLIDETKYPKPGDTITDSSGVVWKIIPDGVTLGPFKTTFVCVTRKGR